MTRRIIALLAIASLCALIPRCSIAAEARTKTAVELRAAVHNTLRETARATDHGAAARRLMEIYRALDADTSIVRDDRLQMQQVVRGRLEKLADEIRKLPAVQAAGDENSTVAGQGLQEFLDILVEQSTKPARAMPPAVLAQQRGNQNGPVAGRFAGQNPVTSGPPADYGQDLVELIEATIAPSSWDTNGGPGTIRYFSPLRVIVVRQTSEVHEQLGDLLPQLRN